nr:unnamed protein product [Callosobruchus analis]
MVIRLCAIYAVKVKEPEVSEASETVLYKYPRPVYTPELGKYNELLQPSDITGKNTNQIATALVLSSILGLQPPSKHSTTIPSYHL